MREFVVRHDRAQFWGARIGWYRLQFCLSLAVVTTLCAQQLASAQQGPAPVVVATVETASVSAGQSFVGTATPIRRSAIGSAVDGRVARFLVNAGDFVREGQPLAELLTSTIELELAAARSELELRKEELREQKAGSRPEEIRSSNAAVLAAKAVWEYQLKRRQRFEELAAREAVNADELQLVVSQTTAAEQRYRQAVEEHALVQAGPRIEQIKQTEARIGAQQAVVDRIADQLKKHTVKAPFDGYVISEQTEVGQWLQRGDLITEIIALGHVDIIAQVLETHVPHVRLGETIRVEVPAVPEQLFTGKVAAIVPQADLQARTFPVAVRVENTISERNIPLLKSGMLARVTLPTGPKIDATLVPKDALVLGGNRPTVYVVDTKATKKGTGKGTGTVRPVPVRLGVARGNGIQVIGDLQPNDLVVVRGNERLRPGQDVRYTVRSTTKEP